MPFFTSHSSRRRFLQNTLTASAAVALAPVLGAAREVTATKPSAQVKPFELEEITISELQDGMKSGRFTARSLVEQYSARIDEIDTPHKDKRGPAVNAIIELNPDVAALNLRITTGNVHSCSE